MCDFRCGALEREQLAFAGEAERRQQQQNPRNKRRSSSVAFSSKWQQHLMKLHEKECGAANAAAAAAAEPAFALRHSASASLIVFFQKFTTAFQFCAFFEPLS
jgi:hypothetical protein